MRIKTHNGKLVKFRLRERAPYECRKVCHMDLGTADKTKPCICPHGTVWVFGTPSRNPVTYLIDEFTCVVPQGWFTPRRLHNPRYWRHTALQLKGRIPMDVSF